MLRNWPLFIFSSCLILLNILHTFRMQTQMKIPIIVLQLWKKNVTSMQLPLVIGSEMLLHSMLPLPNWVAAGLTEEKRCAKISDNYKWITILILSILKDLQQIKWPRQKARLKKLFISKCIKYIQKFRWNKCTARHKNNNAFLFDNLLFPPSRDLSVLW